MGFTFHSAKYHFEFFFERFSEIALEITPDVIYFLNFLFMVVPKKCSYVFEICDEKHGVVLV